MLQMYEELEKIVTQYYTTEDPGNSRDLEVDCCHICVLYGYTDVVPWACVRGVV